MSKERKFDPKQYLPSGEGTAISFDPKPKIIASFFGKANRFREFLEGLKILVKPKKRK